MEKNPTFNYVSDTSMFCGYVGYLQLRVESWPENGREFIRKTLGLPEFGPKPLPPDRHLLKSD